MKETVTGFVDMSAAQITIPYITHQPGFWYFHDRLWDLSTKTTENVCSDNVWTKSSMTFVVLVLKVGALHAYIAFETQGQERNLERSIPIQCCSTAIQLYIYIVFLQSKMKANHGRCCFVVNLLSSAGNSEDTGFKMSQVWGNCRSHVTAVSNSFPSLLRCLGFRIGFLQRLLPSLADMRSATRLKVLPLSQQPSAPQQWPEKQQSTRSRFGDGGLEVFQGH